MVTELTVTNRLSLKSEIVAKTDQIAVELGVGGETAAGNPIRGAARRIFSSRSGSGDFVDTARERNRVVGFEQRTLGVFPGVTDTSEDYGAVLDARVRVLAPSYRRRARKNGR